MTADGKIATANRQISSFSSARDKEHLLELRATADAVLAGARTVDSSDVLLGPGGKRFQSRRLRNGLKEFNLRIIASGSGSIDPKAKIFRHRLSPLIVLITEKTPLKVRQQLRTLADEVMICGRTKLNLDRALRQLRHKWNVRRLLCEGGGELNHALFAAGLVDELHLTICPTIFGGRLAPTPVDGEGAKRLRDTFNLQLKSIRRTGDEVFLVYTRRGR
jgi:riboflavin-specific deaminase-like protein